VEGFGKCLVPFFLFNCGVHVGLLKWPIWPFHWPFKHVYFTTYRMFSEIQLFLMTFACFGLVDGYI